MQNLKIVNVPDNKTEYVNTLLQELNFKWIWKSATNDICTSLYGECKEISIDKLISLHDKIDKQYLTIDPLTNKYRVIKTNYPCTGMKKIPNGATFLTGDVFRKDGFYYDNGTCKWCNTYITINNLHNLTVHWQL